MALFRRPSPGSTTQQLFPCVVEPGETRPLSVNDDRGPNAADAQRNCKDIANSHARVSLVKPKSAVNDKPRTGPSSVTPGAATGPSGVVTSS